MAVGWSVPVPLCREKYGIVWGEGQTLQFPDSHSGSGNGWSSAKVRVMVAAPPVEGLTWAMSKLSFSCASSEERGFWSPSRSLPYVQLSNAMGIWMCPPCKSNIFTFFPLSPAPDFTTVNSWEQMENMLNDVEEPDGIVTWSRMQHLVHESCRDPRDSSC